MKQEYEDINPTLWKMVKMKTRETWLKYSPAKNSNLQRHEQDLEQENELPTNSNSSSKTAMIQQKSITSIKQNWKMLLNIEQKVRFSDQR